MSTSIKYIAVVKGAKEVILAGTADLTYWRERLRSEGLCPCPADNGRAQLLVSGVESKWIGVTFRELSISVVVCGREGGSAPDGVYLVAAFNSSRLFAWCERAMLKTPYRHGRIGVRIGPPASFGLRDGRDVLLRCEQSTRATAARETDVVWDLKIFLPTRAATKRAPGKLFHARLSGLTEFYPYSPMSDVLTLAQTAQFPEIACLVESQFTAREWQIRRCATHARSRTLDRDS